jgi:hypothetical protein
MELMYGDCSCRLPDHFIIIIIIIVVVVVVVIIINLPSFIIKRHNGISPFVGSGTPITVASTTSG